MNPCPKCGSYRLRIQTPIVCDILPTDTYKQLLGKWARATKDGATPLEGPVYMCVDCRHKGPAVDCTSRTREEIGKDPKVSAEVKRLWNEQAI